MSLKSMLRRKTFSRPGSGQNRTVNDHFALKLLYLATEISASRIIGAQEIYWAMLLTQSSLI